FYLIDSNTIPNIVNTTPDICNPLKYSENIKTPLRVMHKIVKPAITGETIDNGYIEYIFSVIRKLPP
ncbi:hypothetical protein AB4544_05730, partial [Vibrio sp. 10N.222.45.F7]|uniref:hypothetical protein n=1 Tax=Vibrio sp. 10N.222.45.F7 TaxID=3229598 RepID=UPI00354E495C